MVVARKNVRDFRNVVINPRDHLVLPDKRRLSRNDVSELLSNQQFWIDNPHMRSLIPQLLEYMVSPYNGKPTVAKKKVRGGGLWEDLFAQMDIELGDDEPTGDANPAPLRHGATARPTTNPTPLRHGATARPTKSQLHHGATKRTIPPPEFTSNMPPGTRNMVYTYGAFMENNSNMSDAPLRHGATARPTTNPAPIPWGDQKPAAKPVPLRHGATARQPNPVPATHSNKKPTGIPLPADSTEHDEYLKAGPRASTGNVAAPPPPAASTGNVAAPLKHGYHGYTHGDNRKPAAAQPVPLQHGYHGHTHGDKAPGTKPAAAQPPPYRTVVPPTAPVEPAPPVMPIPPVSAPTAPPVRGDVSPLSWLMDEAFRQNRTSIIQKLYPLIGSKRAHALPIVDLIKVAGVSEDEFTHLTDLHRAGNMLNFPVSDNTGISSNGIPVVHVHGEQFGPRSNPARPLVIRTNAGTNKIKSFA
mgnify:CR=1 FL=1